MTLCRDAMPAARLRWSIHFNTLVPQVVPGLHLNNLVPRNGCTSTSSRLSWPGITWGGATRTFEVTRASACIFEVTLECAVYGCDRGTAEPGARRKVSGIPGTVTQRRNS
eukprot:1628190-Rhodomonas_salina.1